MLALIIVAFMSVIVYMIKRQNDSMKEERKAAAALRESDKVESKMREQIAADREDRMAKRIDVLEDQIKSDKEQHSNVLMQMIERVTTAIAASTEEHAANRRALEQLTLTMDKLNGDIRDMCRLLQMSPCLMAGLKRGDIRITDKEGNVLTVEGPEG